MKTKLWSILSVLFIATASAFIFSACDSEDPAPTVAPTGLSGAQSGTSVNLQWNAVSGATSYRVFRSNSASGTFTQIGEPSGTTFTDFSPLTGTNFYRVSAVNHSGEGPQSGSFSVSFTTAPSAPTGLSATQSNDVILLSWNAVQGAVSYSVYIGQSSTGPFQSLGNTANTGATITTPNTTGYRHFRVSAVNSAGERSPQSATVSINFIADGGGGTQPPPPPPGGGGGGVSAPATPTGLTARVVGTVVQLDWNNVSGATNFRVFRSSSSAGPFLPIATPSSNWFDDNNPLSGNNFYRVSAVNSAGESAQSATVSVNFTAGGGGGGTQPPPGGGGTNPTPGPVRNLAASGNLSSINVTWQAPLVDTWHGAATSYRVYKRNPNTAIYEFRQSVTTTSWRDNSPHPGMNRYRVVPVNNAGNGTAWSIFTQSIPLPTPPTNIIHTVSWGTGSQNLEVWIRPQQHATHYRVFWSTSSTAQGILLGEVSNSHRPLFPDIVGLSQHLSLPRGTTIYLRVETVFRAAHIGNDIVSPRSQPHRYTLP